MVWLPDDLIAMNCNETFFLCWEGTTDKKENLQAYDTEEGTISCIESTSTYFYTGSVTGVVKFH